MCSRRRQRVRINSRIHHMHRRITTLQIHIIVVVLGTISGRRRSGDRPGGGMRCSESRRMHSRKYVRHRMRTRPTGGRRVTLWGRRLEFLLRVRVTGVDGVVEGVRVRCRVDQRPDFVPKNPADGAD